MTYKAILIAYAMQTNRKLITVFILALVGFMVSGSAASANAATIQKLPTCTDPTGQNLPCMMVISTLCGTMPGDFGYNSIMFLWHAEFE